MLITSSKELISMNISPTRNAINNLKCEGTTYYVLLVNILTCRISLDRACKFEIERFSSFKCRKTKTKVITLANHKGHRQSSEPIKTQSKYTKPVRSGKCIYIFILTGGRLLIQTANQFLFHIFPYKQFMFCYR